jgi:hypothetical protein
MYNYTYKCSNCNKTYHERDKINILEIKDPDVAKSVIYGGILGAALDQSEDQKKTFCNKSTNGKHDFVLSSKTSYPKLINSLNNPINKNNITKAHFENKYAATIWPLLKKGTIGKIEGFDIVEKDPSVFFISKRLFENDIITEEMVGTESQVMARIYICCNTESELKNKISEIYNTIKVLDKDNNNQLINSFKYE